MAWAIFYETCSQDHKISDLYYIFINKLVRNPLYKKVDMHIINDYLDNNHNDYYNVLLKRITHFTIYLFVLKNAREYALLRNWLIFH